MAGSLRTPLMPVRLSLVLVALLVVTSLTSLVSPGVYAAEPPLWRVQIVVQDWVNFLILAPALGLAAWGSRRGSHASELVLGGALMYAVYNLVIYSFAVRFNRLFLAYSIGLGLAVYALILQLMRLGKEDVPKWFSPETRVRGPAIVLVVLAVAFAVLWLSEILPAAFRGDTPRSLEGTGLLTNPVHALDLSVTLPTLFLGGVLLWRRAPWGFRLAVPLLTFALLTDVAIVAIILGSRAVGLPGEVPVAAAISAVAVVTAGALAQLLRGLEPARVSARGRAPRTA